MAAALALVLHAHQPVGNFDRVIEEAYQQAYRPFVVSLARRRGLRLTLHFSGFLLDWLAERHPDYFALVAGLVAEGRVEILGGGYYEPILAAIPAGDQRVQLRRLSDAVEQHFGTRPRGAWLAERVWEPGLASVLARAEITYTLLDDTHFALAGVAEADLHGAWLTEDQGFSLGVVPSNFFLRQAIPFQPVEASLDYLRQHGGGLVTMGDDLEKFGSWPGTHQHCYGDGWLERFWDGLEAMQAGGKFETLCLGEAIKRSRPRGLVYLPTASYPEMMRWAGSASWRAFFTKYPESNLIHKTLEDLHERWRRLPPGAEAEAVHEHLLAAETNDVYWHGWFGGLYSPHLRNVAYGHLLAADALIERMAPVGPYRRFDLHRDGTERVELRTAQLRVLLAPEQDGGIEELDVRACNANIVNAIARRPEPYHEDLRAAAAANPAHLPGGVTAPQRGLDAMLRYDAHSEPWIVVSAAAGRVELAQDGVRKTFILEDDMLTQEWRGEAEAGAAALEWTLGLPGPGAGTRPGAEKLSLRDGWRDFRVELEAPGAERWEIEALHTVSQAEHGFEAIYQGSRIRAVWPPETRVARTQLKIFLD